MGWLESFAKKKNGGKTFNNLIISGNCMTLKVNLFPFTEKKNVNAAKVSQNSKLNT